MPTSRFFGYIKKMNEATEPKSKHKLKVDKLDNTLTEQERKELYG